jgi:hypothetical protein
MRQPKMKMITWFDLHGYHKRESFSGWFQAVPLKTAMRRSRVANVIPMRAATSLPRGFIAETAEVQW